MVKKLNVVLRWCVCLWSTAACVPTSRPPAVAAPKPAVHVGSTEPAHPPDPPDTPTFVQRAGKATATDLAPANATVIGRLQTPNASYLLLRGVHENEIGEAVLDSVTDSDGRPVVAAVTGRDTGTQSLSSP